MACALLLGMAQAAWAQEDTLATAPVDTTAAAQVDTSATASVLVQESLLPYRMQKRYRPVNQPFHKGGFFANSYFSITGAAYRQWASNYSNGPFVSGAFGKWVNPYNGIELSGGWGTFMDNYDATRLSLIMAKASYLFNLSAYVDGYNPDRMVEIYPRAGMGVSIQRVPGEDSTTGLVGYLGMDFNIHILPGVDLVIQPLLEIQKESRRLARMDIWRNYLLATHMGYGLRLTLDRERVGGDPGGDWFMTASTGPQVQLSKFLLSEERIRFMQAIGDASTLGVGRYYSKAFALRFSLGYSWHYWKEIQEGETDEYGTQLPTARFRSSYFFARVEGGMDILRVLGWIRPESGFALSILTGPEVGAIYKKDPYYKDILFPYVGFTVAPQVKVRVFRGFSLFVEPRLSYVPYSAYAFQSSTINRNYYDAVVSLSLGAEIRFFGKQDNH